MNLLRSKLRAPFTVPLVLFAIAVGYACSGGGDSSATGPYGDDPTPPPDPDPDVVTVELTQDLTFSPAEVTIEPGTTVRWTNSYDIDHTVTPDDPDQEGVWDSQPMSEGDQFEYTFDVSGETYDYHCTPHQAEGMTGTITVE